MTRPRSSRARTAGLALTLALLAACGDADGEAPEQPGIDAGGATEVVTDLEPDEPDVSPGEDESPEPFAPEDAAVTALGAAQAVVENGRPFELDRSDDDGEDGWEVHVAVDGTEREIHVSADGSTVVREEDEDSLDSEDRSRLDAAPISATEAAVSALNDISGTVEEIELDGPTDSPVWRIEVRTTDGADVDVRVDAVTGEVQ